LNGFSPNVQDILDNFKFRNQLSTLSKADALGTLINKFLNPENQSKKTGFVMWAVMWAAKQSEVIAIIFKHIYKQMAEGEGFEPSRRLRACRFSRPVPSTTRPPLRNSASPKHRGPVLF
jgi:hypothetical protein